MLTGLALQLHLRADLEAELALVNGPGGGLPQQGTVALEVSDPRPAVAPKGSMLLRASVLPRLEGRRQSWGLGGEGCAATGGRAAPAGSGGAGRANTWDVNLSS